MTVIGDRPARGAAVIVTLVGQGWLIATFYRALARQLLTAHPDDPVALDEAEQLRRDADCTIHHARCLAVEHNVPGPQLRDVEGVAA